MAPKKIIYPIFLPHAGCPFQCIYCNQNAVTSAGSAEEEFLPSVLRRLYAHAEEARRLERPGEIAFFGGTFTALAPELIGPILQAASAYVREDIFTGIRFSTRPDCLGREVLELLSGFPVQTVELGVQSLSEEVLAASRRGYSGGDVRKAVASVKEKGWSLGIQLMAGLPGDKAGLLLESVRLAIEMRPDFLRIYPTLVLRGTALAALFNKGEYKALSLDDAIAWLEPAYDMLLHADIPIIRMGLHPDAALEEPGVVLAGPIHPSFGYLVKCRWWRNRVDAKFASLPETAGCKLLLRVPANQISEVVGPARENVRHWKTKWHLESLEVKTEQELHGMEMQLECQHIINTRRRPSDG